MQFIGLESFAFLASTHHRAGGRLRLKRPEGLFAHFRESKSVVFQLNGLDTLIEIAHTNCRKENEFLAVLPESAKVAKLKASVNLCFGSFT
jgi:hypothetical protein